MAIQGARLADFTTNGHPESGIDVELICRDQRSTYLLPFPCRFDGEVWINQATGEVLATRVLGWRPFPRRRASEP